MKPKECTVIAYGHRASIELVPGKYSNGRIAFRAIDTGTQEPWGVLTVNLPDETLGPNEIFVKAWSENAEWVPQVLKKLPNHFKDTGKRVPTGHVEAQVWEVLDGVF